jgi:hypothetical protein
MADLPRFHIMQKFNLPELYGFYRKSCWVIRGALLITDLDIAIQKTPKQHA